MITSDLELLERLCRNYQVVLCHGCFDILHAGHVDHLRQARKFGDMLIVTVTPDRFVNRGIDRPFFPEKMRLEMVDAIRHVDYAAVNRWPTAVELIKQIKPAIFCKGGDYNKHVTPMLVAEIDAMRGHGGEVVYTNGEIAHSTEILEKMKRCE